MSEPMTKVKNSRPLYATYRTPKEQPPDTPVRRKIFEVIFEADTPGGKAFDIALLIAIIVSVMAVMAESVTDVRLHFGFVLIVIEWIFTILFSIEYILRLISVRRPIGYALSFFGLVDLLAVVPTYVSVLVPGAQTLLVIRVLRLLRVFRVFKLTRYLGEARLLTRALAQSRQKIIVFLVAVLTVVVIMGSLMYLVEGPANGFTSIPRAVYWAIVTMTTVGYGDIAPRTVLGQTIAAFVMILGYGIIAVPTGIFSAELVQAARKEKAHHACPTCGRQDHDSDAKFCKYCGGSM